jgi:hypothetical protein
MCEDYLLCPNCILENDVVMFHSSDHLFYRVKGNGSSLPSHKKIDLISTAEPMSFNLQSLGLSVDFVKEMLRRENELRLSETTLNRFKTEGSHLYVPITEEIQLQVCQEFGLSEEVGLTALRCADSLMPTSEDREDIKEISFYRKYNRMRDGDLSEGDHLPPICFQYPFHTLDSQLISLEKILSFPQEGGASSASASASASFGFTDEIINIVFASSIS